MKSATQRTALNLVIKDNSFYWEAKDKSKPADFVTCSITFTNPIRQQGISFLETIKRDSVTFTEQVIKGGQDCRFIPADKFCYFRVDDQYFSSLDNVISFEITYFDETNSSFEVHYNAAGVADKSIVITRTNTNKWLTKNGDACRCGIEQST